jgi:hypothetical protein
VGGDGRVDAGGRRRGAMPLEPPMGPRPDRKAQ